MIIDLQYSTIKEALPDFVYKSLFRFSSSSNDYFPQPEELINLLSLKFGLKKANIFLTAGCDEAILMLGRAYNSSIVIFTPTYIEYANEKNFGKNIKKIFSLINGEYKIVPKYYHGSSLIFIANPNNPIGFTEKETIYRLILNNPQAIVVIDEVYSGFSNKSVIGDIYKFKNLVVLRSFSKDYGMAGIRIGFIAAEKNIIDNIRGFAQETNTSYLSVGAAISGLSHESYFSKMRGKIIRERNSFCTFLDLHKLKHFKAETNVVLLKFSDESRGKDFFDFLKAHGINTSLGNGGSNVGLDKSYIRITIGTKKEMFFVRKIIRKFSQK